ncbi:BMP family lipoprotein [Haladaptatus pallidirubidus]|uniref:BMP family protein n=1 Tax=Haladaptatus pallidirubidus TaxID=1008152 RepID=A0AAV3UJ00_9EURY|nr:BMP family ABC transporter substrate-binding protein [Haladaptatus pallidirubidus]
MDRRNYLKVIGASTTLSGLAGCLGGNDGNGGGSGNGATNIALVSSPAGFDDDAFNDLALEGLKSAQKEHDIEINKVEETQQAQYQSTQSELAQTGKHDLIVLVSYNHTQALTQNAADYPDQNWMLINDHVDESNVAGYTWANHQMSYLAGVLGGTLTTEEFAQGSGETGPENAQIGFVGGVDESLINAFEQAYIAGAKWVTENVNVNVGYIGNYTDTDTAADIASSQYDAGADIVYHAAAAAGRGVFEAAQAKGRFAIGVDSDQSQTLPDFQDVILGSAVKYINEGTREVATAVAKDNFKSVSGENILTLEDEAIDCVIGQAFEGDLPGVVDKNLEEAKQGIINDEIKVPCTATGCNGS